MRCERSTYDSVYGLPTFRYALAHHKPESFTAFPPVKHKDSAEMLGFPPSFSHLLPCQEL